jgi:hypothetical protein
MRRRPETLVQGIVQLVGQAIEAAGEGVGRELEMVRFVADARSEVGQQPDLFTCIAEPFVGCFGEVVAQLGNLILFHGSSLLES